MNNWFHASRIAEKSCEGKWVFVWRQKSNRGLLESVEEPASSHVWRSQRSSLRGAVGGLWEWWALWCWWGVCIEAAGRNTDSSTLAGRSRTHPQTFVSPVGGLGVHTALADEEEEKDEEGCGVSLTAFLHWVRLNQLPSFRGSLHIGTLMTHESVLIVQHHYFMNNSRSNIFLTWFFYFILILPSRPLTNPSLAGQNPRSPKII